MPLFVQQTTKPVCKCECKGIVKLRGEWLLRRQTRRLAERTNAKQLARTPPATGFVVAPKLLATSVYFVLPLVYFLHPLTLASKVRQRETDFASPPRSDISVPSPVPNAFYALDAVC